MNNKTKTINYPMIADDLGKHEVIGDPESISFNNIKSIMDANETSLVFIAENRTDKEQLISGTLAGTILVDDQKRPDAAHGKVLIMVENPRVVFSKIANRFFVETPQYGIHPSAIIHPEARISPKVYIGPHCVIGRGEIQENTIIYGSVFIYDNFFIGKNVKIHAGTVIGAEGFGYNRDADGTPVPFPHIGSVIIEDDVEIGSNTSIDRGALSDTIIKKGAKIDNLVHVAHNVIIGENAFVIAHAMLGGSSVIGSGSTIAPSAAVKDQIKIGSNTFIGMAASVLKNVPDNQIWTGVPAQPLEKIIEHNKKLQALLSQDL